MTGVTHLFTIATVLAALLASISIWAPRRLAIKGTALATATLFLPVAYLSFVDLLSKPKPVDLEWWLVEAEEATVLGSALREDEGIYLWLQLPNAAEPRAYRLPWSRETAEQLQGALREAEEQAGQLQMRRPFESSLDDQEPMFYARPQPALPPKDEAEPGPQIYEHPGQAA
jgi:hypothetical protein